MLKKMVSSPPSSCSSSPSSLGSDFDTSRFRVLSTSSSGNSPIGSSTLLSRQAMRRFDLESGLNAVLYKDTHQLTTVGEVKDSYVLELTDKHGAVVNAVKYKRLFAEGDDSDFILLPLLITTYNPDSGEAITTSRLKSPDELPNSIRSYFVLSDKFNPIPAQKFASQQPEKEGWFFEVRETTEFKESKEQQYESQFFGVLDGAWYELLSSPNLGTCLWPVTCFAKGGSTEFEWGIYCDSKSGKNKWVSLKEVESGKPEGMYRKFLSTMKGYHESPEAATHYHFSRVPFNFSWVSVTANSEQFSVFKFSLMSGSQRDCVTYKSVSEFKEKDFGTFNEMRRYLRTPSKVAKNDNPVPTGLARLFNSIKSAE